MSKIISVNDRVSFSIESKRVFTDEGFLIVPGRVARTGIQQYLASELGIEDRAPNDIISVYRPAEEVFHTDSLATYLGADVTIEHPAELVNSKTFHNVTAGTVRSAGIKDGDFVQAELVVKSQAAIDAIHSGKVQLSAGYTAVYDPTPGFTPDNEPYDFIQRDIKINHVALVDRARAGVLARIFDNKLEENAMSNVVLDSGRKVEVADAATAALLQDHIDRLTKRANDAEGAQAEAEKKAEDTEEELEEEKKKSSEDAISQRVTALLSLRETARKVAGDSFKCESTDSVSIMRAALVVARPKVAWDSKSEAYIEAAFDAESEKDEDEEDKKDSNDAQLRQLANDGARHMLPKDEKPSPRNKYTDSVSQGWKTTLGEAK